ncbi:MAG: Deoxyuridine 5'-triphosphate nucleotidohydrolase Dut [Candidatus Uhrbacteria bacterium GW2011_GWF2_41_16]|jgi:dUTP pyrophosphatase|uniref:dUTP diphosphatase n=2 Tax=Candidatus Uhriibacteriota TaxID=1752732 RepID=A0A0G0XPJ8_9BACT|nr:MAG: Deoxyuridine 5'-triphosphate nucleotidohydrolase Dut [Candidatus Uhrbacteria bacterium GW2011_GWA2_41_10]KKR87786.1 MAG: Deoxyuridine 5'-triphosphate nucleotidohydrolase Dut [Candidatus Uhrbacteria bacterium GW2011_GWC2_41_11]KKR98725.1 MAG: Deoxyuridine 5'-triphosphate nucleotidohydrolase Dut [Candidatus Uhrbacteria bacterium GW2011_GWF2_41_16]HBP00178.1 dUTP diphosphatase [Candidatus Uhrbacteria bacterium]
MNIPCIIRRLDPEVPFPVYKTPGAVAFDLAVFEETDLTPGETKMLRTGLVICVPEGYAIILAPRSSNAKKGIRLGNGIGVVDQDYCGPEDELRLALHNFGTQTYHIEKGERLAQGFLVPVAHAQFEEGQILAQPNRGGFGSTGFI